MAGGAIVFLHLLVVVAAAFLLGVRAYGETHPNAAQGDEDSLQLRSLGRSASTVFLLVMLAAITAIDFGFVDLAKVVR